MRYRESSTESSLATSSFTRIAGGIPTYLTVLRSPKKAFPPLYLQTKLAKSYPHERANSSAILFSSAVYPALPIFITQRIQPQRYKLTSSTTASTSATYPQWIGASTSSSTRHSRGWRATASSSTSHSETSRSASPTTPRYSMSSTESLRSSASPWRSSSPRG